MVYRQSLLKLLLLLMITLSSSFAMIGANQYNTLVWKAHNGMPFHLVIKLDEDNNSFIIRRLAANKVGEAYQWEEFVIKPNVKKYGEEYIYSFLKQLFSLTKPYSDFSHDVEDSEVYLCESARDTCIRVSTQLFDREDNEFTFYKYISQLK